MWDLGSLPAHCAWIFAAAVTLVTFAYTLHVTLGLASSNGKYLAPIYISRILRSLAVLNVSGPVSWIVAWRTASATRYAFQEEKTSEHG
jgi:Na+/serine symporter